jgi:hypothetical protein
MRRVEGFIFAPEDARRLAALRIGLCGLLAWRLAIGDFSFVADQPAALFQPVSFMKLLPEMPSHDFVVALQVAGVAAALLAAAGLWMRLSLPVAFASALVLNGMLNSTGKIVHNDVLLLLCLVPLLASPGAAGAAWRLRHLGPTGQGGLTGRLAPLRRRGMGGEQRRGGAGPIRGEAYGWPVRTAMVVVALAYFFVGLQKLRFSGLDWVTSDNLRWALYASSDSQAEPNALALFVADRVWLAHLLAAGTVFVELCFPLALVLPRLRWLLVPAVVSLHLGIWLAMGLDYSAQALTVIIVFVDWPIVVEWVRRRAPAIAAPLRTERARG